VDHVSLGQALSEALAARVAGTAAGAGEVKKDGEGDVEMKEEPAAAADGAQQNGGAAAAGAAAEGGEAGVKQEEAKEGAAGQEVTDDMLRVLDWHWANLEYGCSAALEEVGLGCGRVGS
jgi:hypothetical protein